MGLRVPPAFPAASRCTVGGEVKVCSQCCRVKLGGGHGVCPCHLGAAPEFAGVSKHVTWNTSLPRVSGTVAVGPVLAPGRESGPVSVAAEGRPGAEIDGVEVVAALAEAEAQMADGRRRTGVCSGPPARPPEHRSRPWAGVPAPIRDADVTRHAPGGHSASCMCVVGNKSHGSSRGLLQRRGRELVRLSRGGLRFGNRGADPFQEQITL